LAIRRRFINVVDATDASKAGRLTRQADALDTIVASDGGNRRVKGTHIGA
jgi:hypothetical protein